MFQDYSINDIKLLGFMLFIDIIWITFNRKKYKNSIKKATGVESKLNLFGSILAYVALMFSYLYFSKKLKSKMDMAILGLCLYAVWNTTNMAIFKDWDKLTALLDTAWGGFLFGATYHVGNSDLLNSMINMGSNLVSKTTNMVSGITINF